MDNINPKFVTKIKSLDVPPSIKKILIKTLEAEQDVITDGYSQGEINRLYDRKLTEYLNDKEVFEFCDKYER